MFCSEDSDRVMACFSYPLGISVRGAPVLVHSDNLCFRRDSVEEFLDVITKCCANVMGELLGVLQEHDVIKSQIIDGFAFSVGCDVRRECVCQFKPF